MRFKLSLMFGLLLAAAACGGDHLSPQGLGSSSAAIVAADESAGEGDLEALYRRVTWLFQCPNAPLPPPVAGPGELALVDAGPHRLLRERLFGVPFRIKGKLCPTERLNRDAIFIVDVSGSMSGNDSEVDDPANPGVKTCGRFEAYKAVMANIPVATGNFAVVSFGSGVTRDSTRLFSSRTDMEAELVTRGPSPAASLKDVFCETPGTSTDYASALERARQIFESSRQSATKEIYFLTDGSPTDGASAEAKATELKTVGIPINGQQKLVTIATVMLGTSDPALLRDRIASKDTAGQPIHANAANAADLARILDGMSDNRLAGSHVKHGTGSNPAPTTIDIMPHLNTTTLEFELPETVFAVDLAQPDYQVKFEYWDTNLNYFTVIGRLDWQDR